jgi:hypothetical protein
MYNHLEIKLVNGAIGTLNPELVESTVSKDENVTELHMISGQVLEISENREKFMKRAAGNKPEKGEENKK